MKKTFLNLMMALSVCAAPALSGCSDDDDEAQASTTSDTTIVYTVDSADYAKVSTILDSLGYSDNQLAQITSLLESLKGDAGTDIISLLLSQKDGLSEEAVEAIINQVVAKAQTELPQYLAQYEKQLTATFITDLCDVMQANAAMFIQLGFTQEQLMALMAGMQKEGAATVSDITMTSEGFCMTVEIAENFAYFYKLQAYIKPLIIQVLAKDNYKELRTMCRLFNKSLIITIKDANSDSSFVVTIAPDELVDGTSEEE